jgi:hypothetical protein
MPTNEYEVQVIDLLERCAGALEKIAENTERSEPFPPPQGDPLPQGDQAPKIPDPGTTPQRFA